MRTRSLKWCHVLTLLPHCECFASTVREAPIGNLSSLTNQTTAFRVKLFADFGCEPCKLENSQGMHCAPCSYREVFLILVNLCVWSQHPRLQQSNVLISFVHCSDSCLACRCFALYTHDSKQRSKLLYIDIYVNLSSRNVNVVAILPETIWCAKKVRLSYSCRRRRLLLLCWERIIVMLLVSCACYFLWQHSGAIWICVGDN